MRYIDLIIVHCSASDNPAQDNIEAIRELHTALKSQNFTWGRYETTGKGWSDVGYHYFIQKDGTIEKGRPLHIPGAHVRGHNKNSIGVCFSGESGIPTKAQKQSWQILKNELLTNLGLDESQIFPHNHFDSSKTCPNFDLEILYKE